METMTFQLHSLFTRTLLIGAFFLISTGSAVASEDVIGVVEAEDTRLPMVGVTVRLVNAKDSSIVKGAITNKDGEFEIENVDKGVWRFRASSVGYHPDERILFVRNDEVNVGTVVLTADSVTLQNVLVEAEVVAVEMSGDTTIFNAKAYKVNEYATSEDLVKKMPGITVNNGQVSAQGETVKRVLVDGRRFFGDDPQGTLKSVPADMVEKVQVYDGQTDQAKYSGFEDGETDKTLNLVTKSDRKEGQFGKVYGGYGTDKRWSAGVAQNYFNGPQRVTLLGLTNNINQQNFAVGDILSSMGISGRMGRGMSQWASMGGASNMLNNTGGGSFSNLFVNNQSGITTTHMLGTTANLELGEGIELDGSYLFNYADNDNSSILDRNYVQPSGQLYQEDQQATSIGRNHTMNLRIDADLDSANSLLFNPSFRIQSSTSEDGSDGLTTNVGDTLSAQRTFNGSAGNAANIDGDVTYRHMFSKGRVMSVSGGVDWNNGDANGNLASNNIFAGDTEIRTLDQISVQANNQANYRGSISYTEPFRERDQLFLRYRGQFNNNELDKKTFSYDSAVSNYTIVEPALTNVFDNNWTSHTGEVRYRIDEGKTDLTVGIAYQNATLGSESTFPTTVNITRTYSNFLPNAQFQHKFSLASDIRVNYYTSISPPSASQLQNVFDNSNPLQLTLGNPDLEQTYTHGMFIRFKDINWMVGKTLFGFVSGSVTQDYIGTESIVTSRDSVVSGVNLPPGATISRPVNLGGQMRLNSFFTYGFPVGAIESNLNLNGGVSYTRTPGLVNALENFSNNTALTAGFFLGSNFSEDIDISVSYNGAYNVVINTLQAQQDQNYYSHTANAKVIWNFGVIACSTDVANTTYSGLGPSFDQSFTVWNAGIGYRFLENGAAELRLTIFDILRQNDAINRSVNDIFVEDTRTQVLTQYAMVSFSYDLRSFAGAAPVRGGFGRGRR